MKKITVVGGDRRLTTAKKCFENAGYTVDSIGLFPEDSGDISSSQIIVLPVPTTKDGVNVFAPLTNKKIPLAFIHENTNNEQKIFCCNFSFADRRCVDYNTLDNYAILNAIPTAEGAVKLAVENTAFTLWRSQVLVIGFGRVGKVLADRLKGMGCDVTVSARKASDLAMIDALGFKSINTGSINGKDLDFHIIFNTVDAEVINDESLKKTSCRCIIDLSSKGGFDLQAAKTAGITALKAPGLPGITAPKTAGEILANIIIESADSLD